MARLDQLLEQLFIRTGSRLELSSGSSGALIDQHGVAEPAFPQPLTTGQVLLLFAEVVPRELSSQFLDGGKIAFSYATRHGTVLMLMQLHEEQVRVEVRAAEKSDTRTSGKGSDAADLRALLCSLELRHASHAHLAGDAAVLLRIDERLEADSSVGRWTSDALRHAVTTLAPEHLRASVANERSFEFTAAIGDALVHVRGDEGLDGLRVIARPVVRKLPSLEALGAKPALLADVERGGLWLFGAPALHDAAVSMATVTQALLHQRPRAVTVIGAASHAILERGVGLVQHLEPGVHVATVDDALQLATRSDADVICLFDDGGSLEHAARVARGGRAVLVAMSASMPGALLRRARSSTCRDAIAGAVFQRTVRCLNGTYSVISDVTVITDEVRRALANDDALPPTHDLEHALCDLVRTGQLSSEEALRAAGDRSWLAGRLTMLAA